MGGVLVDAGTRVVGCCCCPGLGDQPSRGTARHVSGVQKCLRCTKRNPRKNLGTLGGAEGSQKGTHATAKGCSGVRGCRPGGRGGGGCIPIWGLAFSTSGAQLPASPTLPARSSLCHFVTALPLLKALCSSWAAALVLERPALTWSVSLLF